MTAVKEFSVELKIGHELGVANSFEAYYFYARAASPGKAGSVLCNCSVLTSSARGTFCIDT